MKPKTFFTCVAFFTSVYLFFLQVLFIFLSLCVVGKMKSNKNMCQQKCQQNALLNSDYIASGKKLILFLFLVAVVRSELEYPRMPYSNSSGAQAKVSISAGSVERAGLC